MLVMMCITLEDCMDCRNIDNHVLMKQDNIIEGNNCFVYKTTTCPIRSDILDVYSNLEK